MKTSNAFLICILGAALVPSVLCQGGNNPEECCFQFFANRMRPDLISSYYKTDAQCSRTGVILVTKKAHRVCVDPAVPWVKNIMATLDKDVF